MTGSRLQDHVGYWLRQLSDQVHTKFERSLAEHGVTVAQWNVLIVVYHGDATTSADVARLVGVDPGAVSRVVDRLADKDLMRRVADPQTRRSLTLALTPQAETLVPILIDIADRNDAEFFGHLTGPERDQLTATLRACAHGAHNGKTLS